MASQLPPIPAKRYFAIGEVAELCAVKPHVLRYWEQEFNQLRPMKRSGNRRYYQHHEVLMIRRIRELLYDHGFTISGARNRLQKNAEDDFSPAQLTTASLKLDVSDMGLAGRNDHSSSVISSFDAVRSELLEIRAFLADE